MGYKAFTQLLLVLIAFVIIFTYIKPTFAEIRQTQNEMIEYSEAVENAAQFNQLLRDLIAKERSFSQQDRTDLDKFLPTYIDEIKVMSDLENIADQSGIEFGSVESSEVSTSENIMIEGNLEQKRPTVTYQDFQFSMIASYSDMKNFLRRLESNAYVFEIYGMTFATANERDSEGNPAVNQSTNGDPEYSISFVLRVYAQELQADVTMK